MTNHRNISWTSALRDLKANRASRPDVREQRLRSTAGLRGTPALALSAWRGRSGRRYVVTIVNALDPETPAVVLAVARDPAGLATILAAGTAPGFVVPAGATELHVHRLAETDEDRAAIVDDLAPTSVIRARIAGVVDQLIDTLDADADLEDGADAQPSLGAPENHHASQIGLMWGSDSDREAA